MFWPTPTARPTLHLISTVSVPLKLYMGSNQSPQLPHREPDNHPKSTVAGLLQISTEAPWSSESSSRNSRGAAESIARRYFPIGHADRGRQSIVPNGRIRLMTSIFFKNRGGASRARFQVGDPARVIRVEQAPFAESLILDRCWEASFPNSGLQHLQTEARGFPRHLPLVSVRSTQTRSGGTADSFRPSVQYADYVWPEQTQGSHFPERIPLFQPVPFCSR